MAGAAPPTKAMKMGVDATAMSGESNVVVAKCEKLTIPALQSGSKIHNHGQRSIQRRTTYLVAFCQAPAPMFRFQTLPHYHCLMVS